MDTGWIALAALDASRPVFRTWMEPAEVEALEARNAEKARAEWLESERLGAEILASLGISD